MNKKFSAILNKHLNIAVNETTVKKEKVTVQP